jgi:acetolactate synthase I/II/III large subunit
VSTTVAALTVAALIDNGMRNLYCLPGVQNDPFFDALYDHTDRLQPVQARHEQGAAYMALGAALATGEPQAFCVVPGPGILNATAALATAYAVNAPVLALVGQIPSRTIGRGFGLLHEIPDQLGVLRGLTKFAARIERAEDARAVLTEALQALRSGRPRPVAVEVPVDVWSALVAEDFPIGEMRGQPAPALNDGAIAQAAERLRQARHPMLVLGGGAQGVSREVTELAERLGAPSVAFRNGQGVVAADNPLSVGTPVGHALWPQVDVVVGLGSRLSAQQLQWGVDDDLDIIHIDIDELELGRVKAPAIGIHADLKDALPALLAALGNAGDARENWRAQVVEAKARFADIYSKELGPQMGWLAAIRAALPRDGVFVDELTQCGYVSRFAFPSYAPRTALSTGYQGTLGYGIATAIGAAHARPDTKVVSITGDGGALFTITELACAVQHQIPVTIIVFNDNAFGNVRRLQKDNYNARFIASDLKSPDFVALAESFGAVGMRAETPAALQAALTQAFTESGPVLVEVPFGEVPSPWAYVLPPKVRGV